MRITTAVAFAILLAASAPLPAIGAADGASCSQLGSLKLSHATITAATLADGALPADVAAGSRNAGALPPFCRLAATLAPTSDSDIRIEVWMPLSGWNGKYHAVGNGAFSGIDAVSGDDDGADARVRHGGTDTGQRGNTASFASGHPEKVIDFGWRAIHELTGAAKAIVAALLRNAAAPFVLERLLRGRTPGDEGSAALSSRTSTASSRARRVSTGRAARPRPCAWRKRSRIQARD